jgi:diguanylate cyclase (GGDEF)-like protein
MPCSPRSAAIGVASLASVLLFPAAAAPAGPLPDPPASLPALPEVPTVGVTPGSDGATVDVGAGDTTLQIGAGTSGVTLKRGSRGASPAPGGGASDSLPVSIPTLRPGNGRSATAGSGPNAIVFGSSSRGKARAAGGLPNAPRPGTTSRPGSQRPRTADGAASPRRVRSQQAPFLEFIEHIPGAVIAGIAALAILALAIWGAWVRARRRLERNAFVDPVTGVANAPAFKGLLARELERAKRYKRPLALLVLEVSDARHSVLPLVDQTLRDVTKAIQERLREGDIIARLGHTRFAVICPEATTTSGETLARALEARLEEMRVHAAVGTAERQPTDLGPEDILARAEAGLARPDPDPAADRTQRRALLKVA